MTKIETQWTKNEFLTYLLLFSAHADSIFKTEEKEHILSIIEPEIYAKISAEFSRDNGYVQVQKIMHFQKERKSYTIESIVQEMKQLFNSDDHFHSLEQFALSNIRRLLL